MAAMALAIGLGYDREPVGRVMAVLDFSFVGSNESRLHTRRQLGERYIHTM